MKAKNKLLLLAMYVAVLIGFASIDSLAATITSAASGNWNAGATWVGGVVPSNTDDVIIADGHTVVVNLELTQANGNRSVQSLNINTGGTLRPDAGVRNIEIDNDLTVAGTGVAQYNYLTTGRLNWTFTGATDGSASITSADITKTQFHNLVFGGGGVNASSTGAAGFTVYGNLTVSSISSLDMDNDEVTFNNTAAKTITNSNTITWAAITLATDAIVNYEGQSGSDNNIEGNITIGTDATMTVVAPTLIDLTGGTTSILNSGDLNVNSGAEVNIEHATTLASSTGDINNFNGDLTIGGTTLTIGARSINGTGNLTTGASSVVSLANANGVKAALALSGTRTFNAGTSYVFSGAGDTGFDYSTTGNDVTSVGDLTISGATTSADTFTITGEFSGAAAFTASTGTITISGAATTISGAAKTLNNLTVTSVGTVNLTQGITVAGSFVKTGAGTFDFATFDVTMTGTGTLSLTNTLAFTGGTGANGININGASSNVTLGAPLNLQALGLLTLNNATATFDMAGFALTGTEQPKLTLSAGTVRSSATTGLVGNLTGLGANELSVASGVNYEFYGSTITSLGFAVGGVAVGGTGGTGGTGIDLINDLTIENTTSTINAVGQTIGLLGDLSVETGANMTLAANSLDFRASSAQEIVNNGTLVLFNSTIGATGDASVTTASSFTIAGTMTMNDADDDFTATDGTITFTLAGAGIAYTVDAVANPITLNNVAVTTGANTWGAVNQSTSNIVINGNLSATTNLTVGATQGVTFAGYGKTITNSATMSLGNVVITGTYTTVANLTIAGDIINVSGQLNATTPSTITITGTAVDMTSADVDSLSFYNLTYGVAYASVATDDPAYTVKNNFSSTSTAFDQNTGTIKFTGNPSTITATATAGNTQMGTVVIPSGSKVLMSGAASDIEVDVQLTLNGTIEVVGAGNIDGSGGIVSASGSKIIVNGAIAGVEIAMVNTGGNTFDDNMDLELTGGATAFGLDFTGGNITDVGNLTIGATANLGTFSSTAVALTINGNVSIAAGAVADLDDNTCLIDLAGTSKTFTNLSANTNIRFDDLTVSGTYTEGATSLGFQVGDASASALSITGTWSSTLATGSTILLNGTTDPVLGGTDAVSKVFNNLTYGANVASAAIIVDYTVNGNLVTTALGSIVHTAGTVTLAGTTKSITNAIATRAGLTFFNLNVTGSYTSAGTSGFAIGIGGTLTVSSTGSLTAHTGTTGSIATLGVGFLGNGTIAGTGTKTFGVLAIAGGTLSSTVDFTVNGGVEDAFNNAGTFTATAGTVTMANAAGATSHLAGAGNYTFNDLAITGSAVLNDDDLTINGDLQVSGGSFVSSAGAITFAVAGDDVITNDGTLTFFILDLANTAGNDITTASDFNVASEMIVRADASFAASAGTVTFSGATTTLTNDLAESDNTSLTFYGLATSGDLGYDDVANSGTAVAGFTVKGDIECNGTMDFQNIDANGRLLLTGTAEQNIVIGTAGTNAIDFGFVTLNNEFGAKLVGSTNENDIEVFRTLRLQSGDLDLNGNNIIQIDETAGLLSETTGNTIINTATVASVGYVFVDKAFATFTNNNMNGIGLTMTTSAASTMKVKRYSISRTVGSVDGISRVFSIVSGTTTGLDAKAVFKYDDSELNGLTAADLKMARSSNQITGPYYLESSTINTTNKIITVDNIDGFASGSVYEYWTASVPVIVTTAEITKGLASSALVAGRTAQGIYGLQFTANGDVTVNSITFGLDRDVTIGSEFSKYYLVKSGDNDLSTTSDNTTLISGTNNAPLTLDVTTTGVTFDLSAASQLLTSASNLNYFLVVDVATSVTASTAAIGATFNETNLNVTDGIIEAVSEAGTDYSFKPGLMIDELSNGLTQSPLIASTTSNGLIGFQIKSTTAATDGFDALVVGTNVDVTNIFDEVRLVRSTTNDLTSGTLTTVKTGVISSTGITFTNMNEATTVAAKYYFLVGDVNANVSKNTSSVIFTIADADLNDDVNAGPRYINALGNVSSSFSSASYSFDNSEVTVSQTTPLISQSPYNLGRGVNNQPVYRFTLASDNGNSVAFTKVIAQATLAKGLLAANVTSWKLWSDANGNDYPDTGEQIATGVYNANVAQGNLTFANFTSAQTTTSSKKYIVTVNLATGSTLNGELSVSLLSQSYVTVSSPARVNNFASLTGDTYTVKAPGTATTAKIVGLSTNSVNSGGSVSFTVRTFDANNVPANLTSSSAVALNVSAGGFTFGGTTTGTILAGGNFISITPTMSHTTGTDLAQATATLTGGLPLTTAASPTITVFKTAPTANGTVTLGTATSTTLSISSWTNGTGGTGRLVVIAANQPPTAPTNGVSTYTANTNIGSGASTAQTDAGSFIVATGNSAVTTVTGLTPGVTYYVQVFEYDGSGSTIIYNRTGKTSVSVDGSTGNPAFKATSAGTTGASTLATAANISTDVDVTGTITTEDEATDGKWFKFKVNANRNNFYIKLSDLPANYSLYLYDYTTGNEVLFRTSEALLLENDVVIVNNAAAGNYLIKIFGADNEEFDAATFGLKVVTSANEILSLTE